MAHTRCAEEVDPIRGVDALLPVCWCSFPRCGGCDARRALAAYTAVLPWQPELLTACILVTSHELPVGTVPLALVQRACGTVLIFPPRSVDTAVIRSGSLAADAAVQLRAAKVRPACPLLAREEVASGTVALAGVACSRGR